jgi:hypothetical protein
MSDSELLLRMFSIVCNAWSGGVGSGKIDWKLPTDFNTSVPQYRNKHAATTSKPTLSISSSQPIEPNAGHLREPLIVRVEVVAEISRRVESAHVHNTNSLASVGALGNNTWKRKHQTSANQLYPSIHSPSGKKEKKEKSSATKKCRKNSP